MKNEKRIKVIGIECGCLSGIEIISTGTQRIAYELLSHIGNIHNENRYKLYSFEPISPKFLIHFGRTMENCVLSPSQGYAKIRLPIELHAHPVDIFIGLSQYIPKVPIPTIGFLYDMAFMHMKETKDNKILQNKTSYVGLNATKIITISESSKKDIIQFYHRSLSEVAVIYPGVSNDFTHSGLQYHHKNPYILHVGGLRKSKNIPFIINVLQKVQKNMGCVVDLILAGDLEDQDPEIKQFIQTHNLNYSLLYLNKPTDKMLASLYRGAVCTVMPSLWEGFGLPVIEALSTGCPVLGSTVGSLPEILDDHWICSTDDEEQWIKKLIIILTNKQIRKLCIQNATNIQNKYSWDRFAKLVYEIIQSI
jgi:glycosyltransferase involved in cell wall biosynthesis